MRRPSLFFEATQAMLAVVRWPGMLPLASWSSVGSRSSLPSFLMMRRWGRGGYRRS